MNRSSLNPVPSRSASGAIVPRLFVAASLALAAMSAPARSATIYVTSPASTAVSTVSMSGAVSPLTNIADLHGVAVDASGNLFITSCKQVVGGTDSKVTQITMSGSFSTYATMNAGGFGAYGLAFDPSGNLYVAGFGNSRVFKVTSTGSVSTVATYPTIAAPQDVACDAQGNAYVSSAADKKVVKIASDGTTSTLATLSNAPYGVAVDSSGNVYASIISTGEILRITANGNVSTFASGLTYPRGLTFDADGYLYTNSGQFDIVKIATNGSVSAFASSLPYAIEDLAFSPFNAVAVPEPSTYAIALAGLACGGSSMFRRRRAR